MKKLRLAALFVMLPAVLVAQSTQQPVRQSMNDSLGTLARVKSIENLETLWRDAPRDFAHRAVHAAMYYKLHRANADAVLLNALPSKSCGGTFSAQTATVRRRCSEN